jgi:hypothetical protein
MDAKDVRVDCPCCQSRLELDVRTGKVVRWSPKEATDEAGRPTVREADWGQAAERVERRLGTATDKFDESLQRERSRARDLDDLFRKANERLGREDET